MKEALDFPNTEPMRESTIQRFEYTFELSWKLMSSILKEQGVEVYGTRHILREAYRLGLIDDLEAWFEFADNRNKSSHIYKEQTAMEVYQVATDDFVPHVESLVKVAQAEVELLSVNGEGE